MTVLPFGLGLLALAKGSRSTAKHGTYFEPALLNACPYSRLDADLECAIDDKE
jgi:hypothetical protein